jgi:hypothetical protein
MFVTLKAAFTTLNQTRFTFGNDRITITNITVVHIQYFILLPNAKTKQSKLIAVFIFDKSSFIILWHDLKYFLHEAHIN